MLDFNHVLNTPGYDVQTFMGNANALTTWQTWRKPRGVKWIYMIGVGGGASGQTGINSGTSSGGGAGGSSGAQTMLMIPAMFIPDTLYIQAGQGGVGATTSGALSVAGTNSYVMVEPGLVTAVQTVLLVAFGSNAGDTVPTATAGGVPAPAASVATIANMPLAGRGQYQFLAGQAGGAGGTSTTSGSGPGFPATGLMVQGGCGGGGTSAGTAQGGGGSMGAAIGQTFPVTSALSTSPDGVNFQAAFYQMNYGGTGGVGATNSVNAGKGGAGSPGAGGGGGGGANTTRTAVKGGDGGPGFVIIISF